MQCISKESQQPVITEASMHADKQHQEVSNETGSANTKPEIQQTHISETRQCKFMGLKPIQKVPDKKANVDYKPNRTGIPARLKSGLESLSGFDLSNVKVHYNSPKPKQIGGLAYTQGTNIHLGRGQQKHLPHEGWHVVQQMQGRVTPTVQMKGIGISEDTILEKEAELIGSKASRLGRNDRFAEIPAQLISSPSTASSVIQFQRKVGFEMEDGDWWTWKKTFGLRTPYWRDAEHNRNVRPMTKHELLHQGNGFRLEADELVYEGQLLSDMEFVTDPFPLTNDGYDRLVTTLDQIGDIYTRILPKAGRNHAEGQFIKQNEHNFSVQSAMLSRGRSVARLNLQATQGIGLEDIPKIFDALTQRPAASNQPVINLLLQRAMVGDQDASAMDALEPLLSASTRALDISIEYLIQEIGDVEFETENEDLDIKKLYGLLTAAIGFIRMMKNPLVIQGGAKTYTPMMHRNDFSTLFNLLPDGLKELIREHQQVFIDSIIAGVVGDPELDNPLEEMDIVEQRNVNIFDRFILENEDRDRFFKISGGQGGLPSMTPYGDTVRSTAYYVLPPTFTIAQWITAWINGENPQDILTSDNYAQAAYSEIEEDVELDEDLALIRNGMDPQISDLVDWQKSSYAANRVYIAFRYDTLTEEQKGMLADYLRGFGGLGDQTDPDDENLALFENRAIAPILRDMHNQLINPDGGAKLNVDSAIQTALFYFTGMMDLFGE